MFGETDYDPVRQLSSVPIEEQLDALGKAVHAGKVSDVMYFGFTHTFSHQDSVKQLFSVADQIHWTQ